MRPPFEVTINGKRGIEWERVCGTRRFPVQNWLPVKANLPGYPGAGVYLVALDLVQKETLDKIVTHLADKFGLTLQEAKEELNEKGIPILAEECMVVVNDPARWL